MASLSSNKSLQMARLNSEIVSTKLEIPFPGSSGNWSSVKNIKNEESSSFLNETCRVPLCPLNSLIPFIMKSMKIFSRDSGFPVTKGRELSKQN